MITEKPWLDADIGVSAPTKLTPIDWQARCLKLEGEWDEAKKETQDYRDYIHTILLNIPAEYTKQPQLDLCMQRMKEAIRALQAELTLIKGRQEWGLKYLIDIGGMPAGSIMKCHGEDSARSFMLKFPDAYELHSRYAPGPWVPVAKEGE